MSTMLPLRVQRSNGPAILLNAVFRNKRWQYTAATKPSETRPLRSILIANRGEIALRVNRTASEYGIRTTTLYTNPDARSQHALSSPFAVNLGLPTAYLNGDRIIEVAKKQGCDGIHPGYGFLSENSAFAEKCKLAGLVFIGPPADAIEAMGNKSRSKEIMTNAGVPCIPGYHGTNQSPEYLASEASRIGFPVLLKAVKGGGGKGMRIARTPEEFLPQLESAKSEARNSFGDDAMLVEKYITTPRHVEVQIFADKHGNCVALGERDCSVQRRHQKILEESPAPNLDEETRQDLWDKARKAALAVGYEGAGTVEFIFDTTTGAFFFMEMNTRLQVEHPVTELVTGEDLVHWQLLVAQGAPLPLTQSAIRERIPQHGHAIEARIYAENPAMGFLPSTGRLTHLRTPTPSPTLRIDAGFAQGDEVSSYYDPMIAKLIVRGPDRHAALQKLHVALGEYEIAGPTTNIEFLKRLCVSPAFVAGEVETGYIEKYRDELFAAEKTPPEVWAQAALGVLLQEAQSRQVLGRGFGEAGSKIGFGADYQAREVHLVEVAADGKPENNVAMTVKARQVGPGRFALEVDGREFVPVLAELGANGKSLRSFFPHTRLGATFVREDEQITLFQQGRQYRLQLGLPNWAEEALGMKTVLNSVLAPMPCKVLRVEVKEGEIVKKDQALVVIESMKMETVIRSPQDGIVQKVVHGAGDMCKAGTALVEFIDEDSK
ncbi:hypothetical protein EV356DRAFT_280163 [Viridothelium virens]|uniref:3-methylcrotonyl-CoA carboxylase subunit alpha n=1 Tax=Viridothelium virens TaxID=1048519 RepID=A0A6A6H186_VIRVR|nr:hypothetical protein EV356DRAFT_280163 [Viridothelium virens]